MNTYSLLSQFHFLSKKEYNVAKSSGWELTSSWSNPRAIPGLGNNSTN